MNLSRPSTVLLAMAFLLAAIGCETFNRPKITADLSDPQTAAVEYLKAIQRGDAATAKALSFGSSEEMRWVESLAAMVDGMRKYDDALYTRFGRLTHQAHVDLHDAISGLADVPLDLTQRGSARTDDTNTEAVIIPGAGGFASHFQPTYRLVHLKEGWRINLAATYSDSKGSAEERKQVADSFRQYRVFGEVFRGMARDVLARRFKSVDAAQQELGKRMEQARRKM